MSNTSVGLITNDIGFSLSRLMTRATGHVTLIAPFITQGALERLVAEADPSIPLTIFTRWRLEEIVAGVSDLRVLDTVRARTGSRLLLHPRLHAKVILIDDSVAVLGSSNITDSALAFRDPPNVEIMASRRPIPDPGSRGRPGIPGGLRWDAPGSRWRPGWDEPSYGIYELVIDPRTNTVVHYVYVGRRN